jgi:predicted Zn-ribbon and HTH transcriptional regulator
MKMDNYTPSICKDCGTRFFKTMKSKEKLCPDCKRVKKEQKESSK